MKIYCLSTTLEKEDEFKHESKPSSFFENISQELAMRSIDPITRHYIRTKRSVALMAAPIVTHL